MEEVVELVELEPVLLGVLPMPFELMMVERAMNIAMDKMFEKSYDGMKKRWNIIREQFVDEFVDHDPKILTRMKETFRDYERKASENHRVNILWRGYEHLYVVYVSSRYYYEDFFDQNKAFILDVLYNLQETKA